MFARPVSNHSRRSLGSKLDENSRQSKTVFVRANRLPSPVHLLNITKEIGKRWGEVEYVQAVRDPEMPSRYSGSFFYLTFKSRETMKKLQDQGVPISVPTLDLPVRPGGIGLEDLQELSKNNSLPTDSELLSSSSISTAPKHGVETATISKPVRYPSNNAPLELLQDQLVIFGRESVEVAKRFACFDGFSGKPNPVLDEVKLKWAKRLPPNMTIATVREEFNRETQVNEIPPQASASETATPELSVNFVIPKRVSPLLAATEAQVETSALEPPPELASTTPISRQRLSAAQRRSLTKIQQAVREFPSPIPNPAPAPPAKEVTVPIPEKEEVSRTSVKTRLWSWFGRSTN